MTTVPLSQAHAHLTDIIHGLRFGEQVSVVEDGVVVARIVGERQPTGQRPGPGLCKGMITIVADDDEHLNEFAECMS